MASIEITDTEMVSTTGHAAVYDPHASVWSVSWCSWRLFGRNQAVTALTLTELVAEGVVDATHKRWLLVRVFAAELDIDPDEAVRLILGENAP